MTNPNTIQDIFVSYSGIAPLKNNHPFNDHIGNELEIECVGSDLSEIKLKTTTLNESEFDTMTTNFEHLKIVKDGSSKRHNSPVNNECVNLGSGLAPAISGISHVYFNSNMEVIYNPKYPKPTTENNTRLYQKIEEFKIKAGQELEDGTIATVSNLLFVIDSTGSMGPFINASKEKVIEIAELQKENMDEIYQKMCPDKKFTHHVRVSVVGYRDFCDSLKIELLPFTEDIDYVKYFLSNLCATGGNDVPEDMLSGFNAMMTQDCGEKCDYTNNLVCLITDAPAHGSFMKDAHIKEFGDYEHEKEQWINLIKQMKEKEMDFMIIKAENSVNKTIEFMKQHYDEDEKFKIVVKDLTVVKNKAVSSALDSATSAAIIGSAMSGAFKEGASESGMAYFNRHSGLGSGVSSGMKFDIPSNTQKKLATFGGIFEGSYPCSPGSPGSPSSPGSPEIFVNNSKYEKKDDNIKED